MNFHLESSNSSIFHKYCLQCVKAFDEYGESSREKKKEEKHNVKIYIQKKKKRILPATIISSGCLIINSI